MKKAWRNPRQVVIHQLPPEDADAQRMERLIVLLAIGVERVVSEEAKIDSSNLVDFHAHVLVNTHDPKWTLNGD